MKLRFWGVRGSIAAPGPHTQRYGGNTTCLEIRSDDDDLIILDGGTGIFPLAQSLLPELPLTAHIFITHTHWDHIQGLPFFTPLYLPGNRVRLHGPFDPVTGDGIEKVMEVQLQYSYFPVRVGEMKSHIEYATMVPGQGIAVGGATVTGTLLNHPVVNFGYRVEQSGKSLFFTGDHEPYYNIYQPGDENYAAYQAMLEEQERAVVAAMRGVDVLVADCSYTNAEYPAKTGWGHGTFDSAIRMARQAGVGRLLCTHHEPTRSDDQLEEAFAEAIGRHPPEPDDPQIMLAYEGLEIEIA